MQQLHAALSSIVRPFVETLRKRLVDVALEWEQAFGNAPHITSALSEFDAAQLIGCSLAAYCESMKAATAVQRGFDFRYKDARYQVKANRPSGKRGSFVWHVPKAKNYKWDFLIWILYNRTFEVQEAWLWGVEPYRIAFDAVTLLSPSDYRRGKRLK
jgi:hypothetical protein